MALSLLGFVSPILARSPAQEPDPNSGADSNGVVRHYPEMVGETVADVTFTGANGEEISLSSYRGKPLLIELWATWCAPCRSALPALNRISLEVKGKGLAIISFDQDRDGTRATAYLARHHYDWMNFHDEDRNVEKALRGGAIPLTVLIDAKGKIAYFRFSGTEADLRMAIAQLGPEFASVAPAVAGAP